MASGEAIARPDDLSAVDLPREVWAKGKRPIRGIAVRVLFALSLVLTGFLMPVVAAQIGCIVVGVTSFFLVPPAVDGWLDRLGTKIGAASRSEANGLLGGLEEKRLVALFAPHAWISWQKGRLHLVLQDGRAAAVAFGEAARQLGDVKLPALVAAQAHAYVCSGDRKMARELLVDLEERDALRAWDRMNLGIVYIEEPGRTQAALEHLQAAAEVYPDHPRVQAALALGFARAGEADEARRLIEEVEGNDDYEEDDAAQDLVKRARKDVRSEGGRKPKKAAKAPEPVAQKASKKKKSKKDRRKERRERRREKKAEQDKKAARAKARREAEDAAKAAKRKSAEQTEEDAADGRPGGGGCGGRTRRRPTRRRPSRRQPKRRRPKRRRPKRRRPKRRRPRRQRPSRRQPKRRRPKRRRPRRQRPSRRQPKRRRPKRRRPRR